MMEHRQKFKLNHYHYLVGFLLIALASQVSTQWPSRRIPPRIPGRGFHMARPRIRPPPPAPGRPGLPYFRGPNNMPPHPPMLPMSTQSQSQMHPPLASSNSSSTSTLSPNSSALNYIEITTEKPSATTINTNVNTNANTTRDEDSKVTGSELSLASSGISISDTSTASTSTRASGSDPNDEVVPTDTVTTPSDPNTVFSDRMIELLKKLGELAAEENSNLNSTHVDSKSDRQSEVEETSLSTVNKNDATKSETETDYSALFGGLPQDHVQPTDPQPQQQQQPASLPPPSFPPPQPFYNQNRRVPPHRPLRGPPPPHSHSRPPPTPGTGHFGGPPTVPRHPHQHPHPHPNPHKHPHPHPPPHPPPPPPSQNSMWSKMKGIFSRKRPEGIPPHHQHPHHPNPTKESSSRKDKEEEPEPANPARRLDDNIAEDLNAAVDKKKAKGDPGEKPEPPVPEIKVADFSLEITKGAALQRRTEPEPPPPKVINSRSDEISSSYSNLRNSNSNTMNTLAKLSPKKPIMVFMRAEGIYEIHRTGADAGKVVKKYAGSTKIQFFNGTIPRDNIPPVFLAPEDSDAPIGYGKIPIPKISAKSSSSEETFKPKPTYLSIPEQLELLRKQRDRLKLLKQEMELKKLDEAKKSAYYSPKDTQAKIKTDFEFQGFGGDGDHHTHSVTTYGDNAFHKPAKPATSLFSEDIQIPGLGSGSGTGVSASEGFEIELPSGSDSNGLISNSELEKIVAGLIGGGAPAQTKISQATSPGIHGLKPPAPQVKQVQGQSQGLPLGHGKPLPSNPPPFSGQFRPPPPSTVGGPNHFTSSHETIQTQHDNPFHEPMPPFHSHSGEHGPRPDRPPPKDGVSINLDFYIKTEKPKRPPPPRPPPPGYGHHSSERGQNQFSKVPPTPHYGPPSPHYGPPTPHYGTPTPLYGTPTPHYGPPPDIQAEPSTQYGVPPPLPNSKFHPGPNAKPFNTGPAYRPPGPPYSSEEYHSSSNQNKNILPPPNSFQHQQQNNQHPQVQNPHQHQNQLQNQQQHQHHPQSVTNVPPNNFAPNANTPHGPIGPNYGQPPAHPPVVHSNGDNAFLKPNTMHNQFNDHRHHISNVTHHGKQSSHHQQQQQLHFSGEIDPPSHLHRPYAHPIAKGTPKPSQIYVTESKDERPPGFKPLKSSAKSNTKKPRPSTLTYFGYESESGDDKQDIPYSSIEKLNPVATSTTIHEQSTPSRHSHNKHRKQPSYHQNQNSQNYKKSQEFSEQFEYQGASDSRDQGSGEVLVVHSSKSNSNRRKNQPKSKNPMVFITPGGQNLPHLDKIINSLNLGKYKSQDVDQESEEVAHVHHFPLHPSTSSSSSSYEHHHIKNRLKKPLLKTKNTIIPQEDGSLVQAAVVQNLNDLLNQKSHGQYSLPQTVILSNSNSNPLSSVEQGQGQSIVTISNSANSQTQTQPETATPAAVEFSFGEIAELMQQSQALSNPVQVQQQSLPQILIQPPNYVQPQIIIQQPPPPPQIILQSQLPAQPQILFHNGQNVFQTAPEQQQLPLVFSEHQRLLSATNTTSGSSGALPPVIFLPNQGPGNPNSGQIQPQFSPQQHLQPQPQLQAQPLQLPPITFNPPVITATPGPLVPFVTPGHIQGHGHGHGHSHDHGQHHPVVTRVAQPPSPAGSYSVEAFSEMKPHSQVEEGMEPVLEKLRKEEKIVWKELPGEGGSPPRMVPLRITTEEKHYIHPNGRTEVESAVVDTSIAEEYLGKSPVESMEFFKRSGNPSAAPNEDNRNPAVHRSQSSDPNSNFNPITSLEKPQEHHPRSVFTDLLQAKAEMEKMKQDLRSPFEKIRRNTESSIFG